MQTLPLKEPPSEHLDCSLVASGTAGKAAVKPVCGSLLRQA